MTNAKKFKNIFGLYATELWAMTEQELLDWLGAEPDPASITSDLISRQQAIDMIFDDKIDDTTLEMLKVISGDLGLAVNMTCDRHIQGIKALPSAQPEIIRCKDCKHRPSGSGADHDLEFPDWRCPCQCEDYWYSWKPDDNWFCANAERREEER